MNANRELVLSSDQPTPQTGVDSADLARNSPEKMQLRAWLCRDLNIHGRPMGPDEGYTVVLDLAPPLRTSCERVGDRKLDRAWWRPSYRGVRLVLDGWVVPLLTAIRLDPGDSPVEIELPRLLCKGVA